MNLKTAKLIRLSTLDGLLSLKDGVSLGTVYFVDVDSIQSMFHTTPVIRKFIMAYNDEAERNPLGWFPLEMLEIQ
jgi:hypothetical protein